MASPITCWRPITITSDTLRRVEEEGECQSRFRADKMMGLKLRNLVLGPRRVTITADLEALDAERREMIKLRREHKIDEELMHRIERELDLEEIRLKG